MLTVNVDIDDRALRAILDTLQTPKLDDVAAHALNETAELGEAKATQVLAGMMGLPESVIDDAFTIERARVGALEADLVCSGKAIKMIVFKPTWSRQEGVVLHIAGKDEHYRHSFITTVRHGHEGVFERKGRERLPIRELYGPSVPGMMARSDVLPVVVDAIQAGLPEMLAAEIARQAKRATSTA
jgi:Prophage minor tail protein Z (GPZ)